MAKLESAGLQLQDDPYTGGKVCMTGWNMDAFYQKAWNIQHGATAFLLSWKQLDVYNYYQNNDYLELYN